MTIITCIDMRLGLSFGGKRQSRDRALTKDAVHLACGRKILISEYSKMLFEEAEIPFAEANIFVSKDPLGDASGDDFVFLEIDVTNDQLVLCDELILYAWNRHYPSSKHLDEQFLRANFELSSEFEFEGNSHEKLTRYATKRKKT